MTDEPRMDGTFLVEMYGNWRRRGALIVFGSLLTLVILVVLAAATRTPPPELDYSKMGVHLLLDDGRNDWPVDIWPEHLSYAAQVTAPAGIAVQVIRADDLDTERWQVFMDLAAEHEMTPVLRLATTFDFDENWWNAPAPDPDGGYRSWGERYADFLNALAWPTDAKHVILLNEPNNGHEWGGRPDPAAYARFVLDVAAVLRERVPDVVLLNGALDLYAPHTNGQPFPDSNVASIDANSFMEAMEAAQTGIFATFDIWNNHSYPLGAFREHPGLFEYRFDFMNGAQDTTTPPPEGIHNRGVNGYEWELWKLAQFGVEDIPVMITETGWRHAESSDANASDVGEDYPSATRAAQLLDLALRGARSISSNGVVTWQPWLADARVLAVAPFALNGVPQEWGHTNWLQLDAEGKVLGTYAAFDLVARYPFPVSASFTE